MADWRQIRARIRRAKTGPDAAARLEQLFDKTRDGMVAFELALLEEQEGRLERAIDWYKHAWQRFRRAEWKQKAEEALERHGIPLPEPEESLPETAAEEVEGSPSTSEAAEPAAQPASEAQPEAEPETAPEKAAPRPKSKPKPEPEVEAAPQPAAETEPAPAAAAEPAQEGTSEAQASAETPARPHRRRHRGGRGRGRRKRAAEGTPKAETAPEASAEDQAPPPASGETSQPERRAPAERRAPSERRAPAERRSSRERLPAVHIYRRGEPALASEIKALEAKLRQLLASPPHLLGELNELPANPGVFLVSDVDLTTTYYLEACGNMRSAMDQLVSGRRGRQGSVRSKLGKYLGISDSQASRYLKQHCVARWLDLEESDSSALGHFARAVLRPELMEESD